MCTQEVPASHNRSEDTGTESAGQSPSCTPAKCIPNIPGSTGENDTDLTAGEALTEGEADDDATGVSTTPDAPSSPPSPPQAATSTAKAASNATNARGICLTES